MNLTKNFIKNVFEEAKEEFNSNIYSLDNNIIVDFISSEKFLHDAKNNNIIKFQIEKGIYKNFDKEYPNFFVVYKHHKEPMRKLLGLPYVVTIAFDIAKDKMKSFDTKEVKEYFKYAFLHEIGHIYENDIIEKEVDKWNSVLAECKGNPELAKELLVDDLASEVVNNDKFNDINTRLWMPILRRMQKIKSRA